MKPITFEDLRRKLPGYEHRNVILSETASGKKLEIVTSIRGFMDELLYVSNIWVTTHNGTAIFKLKEFNDAVHHYVNAA